MYNFVSHWRICRKTIGSFLLFTALCHVNAFGQRADLDELKAQVRTAASQTELFDAKKKLGNYYKNSGDIQEYGAISQELLQIAQKLNNDSLKIIAYGNMGNYFANLSDFFSTLKYYLKALEIAEKLNDQNLICKLYNNIAEQYRSLKEYRQALQYLYKAQLLLPQVTSKTPKLPQYVFINFCETFLGLNNSDSALKYIQLANREFVKNKNDQIYVNALYDFGLVHESLGDMDLAETYFKKSVALADSLGDLYNVADATKHYTLFLYNQKRFQEAEINALRGLAASKESGNKLGIINAATMLHRIYLKTGKRDSAYYFLDIKNSYRDSVFNEEQLYKIQETTFNEQVRLQELKEAKMQYENKLKFSALLLVLLGLSISGLLLWRNYRNKQKAYTLLEAQKQQIGLQKTKIEEAYTQLKATQAQLVQREKMASLGDLTAGIAHEIQNPLNFVNNFSELSKEIIEEMERELMEKNTDELLLLFKTIKQNFEKINYHGQRACFIVQNMLQHSRVSKSEMHLVDINSLIEEYMRLSFHAMKAKNKNFNAILETYFDPAIGKVNLVPQDIGQALLNLFNNAFYSVNEKKKRLQGRYEPVVSVRTSKAGNNIFLYVRDNGAGISENVVNKIFEPFFTTKPTGEGTGLGLSLSYDIITKEHGGDIKVNTEEGEYAEFVVKLPVV